MMGVCLLCPAPGAAMVAFLQTREGVLAKGGSGKPRLAKVWLLKTFALVVATARREERCNNAFLA